MVVTSIIGQERWLPYHEKLWLHWWFCVKWYFISSYTPSSHSKLKCLVPYPKSNHLNFVFFHRVTSLIPIRACPPIFLWHLICPCVTCFATHTSVHVYTGWHSMLVSVFLKLVCKTAHFPAKEHTRKFQTQTLNKTLTKRRYPIHLSMGIRRGWYLCI